MQTQDYILGSSLTCNFTDRSPSGKTDNYKLDKLSSGKRTNQRFDGNGNEFIFIDIRVKRKSESCKCLFIFIPSFELECSQSLNVLFGTFNSFYPPLL